MNRSVSGLLKYSILSLWVATAAQAINTAIPSDFPAFALTDMDPGNEGFYYSARTVNVPAPEFGSRPYAFIISARGNVVWFYTDPEFDIFYPQLSLDQLMLTATSMNPPDKQLILFDAEHREIGRVPKVNPYRQTMTLDIHEARLDAEGNLYTLWSDPVHVDMSQWVEGGNPNALVYHAAVQKWDPAGNLLWEWRSLDHVDQLPYTALTFQGYLYSPSFEHLHANSVQMLDNGDLIISALKMDLVFRVSAATGRIEWILGGSIGQFDFTTSLPFFNGPLEFAPGHDAILYPDGRVTVYDDGGEHSPPRAYAREYRLDFDTMTADLIWAYQYPIPLWSSSQGSFRIAPDDQRLICWGAQVMNSQLKPNATEVTPDGEIIWECSVYSGPNPGGPIAPTYRWYKMEQFIPSAEPCLVEEYDHQNGEIRLVANWFGHEAAVSGYQVRIGLRPDNLLEQGVSSDGFYTLSGIEPAQPIFCQIVPVDGNEEPVGPPSEVIQVLLGTPGLTLTPSVTSIPAAGGTVVYGAAFSFTYGQALHLLYKTDVRLPNGNLYGPLFQRPFLAQPYIGMTIPGLTQDIPAIAPAGQYQFIGSVLSAQGNVLSSDQFNFTKHNMATGREPGIGIVAGWEAGGWTAPGQALPETHPRMMPEGFRFSAAWPNPFNAVTSLSFELDNPSELTVTVYNITGQRVATLLSGMQGAGAQRLEFDASGSAGGLYFIRAAIPGRRDQVRKALHVR